MENKKNMTLSILKIKGDNNLFLKMNLQKIYTYINILIEIKQDT